MVVNFYFHILRLCNNVKVLSRFKYKTFSQKITIIRGVFYWQSLHKIRHFAYYLINLRDKPMRE